MTHECRYCASGRVVPVLLKRIERSPTAGNKYRLFCQGCERWLPFCGESDYRQALHPHVLPADGDPDEAAEHIVPLEDYDYGPEWADLVEQATGDRPDPESGMAMADGGDGVEEADEADDDQADEEPESDDEDGEDDVEVINRFECPGCGATVEGYPDECPTCEAPYNW